MKKINFYLQEVLKFLLIFLISFVWSKYFFHKLWLAILISLSLSAIIYITILLITRKKRQKNTLKLKEKEDAENMFLSLSCNDKPIDFFAKLAHKKHENIIKHKDYLVISHEQENVKTVLFADMSFQKMTVARLMEIYNKVKKEKATKIVICCKEISDKDVSVFCQNFQEKIIILDTYETYKKLFKYYDCFPEITQKYNTKHSLAFKDFIAYSLNKNRTKGYLFSAFVLILSGLFVRINIYYCIIASLLVVCAIVSQFNPYFNIKNEKEML